PASTPEAIPEAIPPAAAEASTGTPPSAIAQTAPAPSEPPIAPSSNPAPNPAPNPTNEPASNPAPAESRVLVAEVLVSGADAALQEEVYKVIRTRPGQTATRSQLQEDINRIFATGLFGNVRAVPDDTPLGVRVTFEVTPNPVLQAVKVDGATVLPPAEVDRIFSPLYGSTLNLNKLQEAIKQLTQWYQSNGYVLAQVVGSPKVGSDGNVTLEVAEGSIEDINITFLNDDGKPTNEDGTAVTGRTRDFIVFREMDTKPGAVFNRDQIQKDLRRVFGLGIFEDVQLTLNPGTDPRKVDVSVNLQEKNTAVLGTEVGFSSASGIFGSVSFQEQNLGGNNQKVGTEFQLSERGLGFDVSFTDPWIAGDPNKTSYTVNAYKRRSTSLIFDGGDNELELDNGDTPRVDRTGGRVVFSRPLSSTWSGSLGAEYQHVEIVDSDGDLSPEDEDGNQLAFNDDGKDDIFTLQLALTNDQRNDRLNPTGGSFLRLGIDQAIPITGIFFTRVRANYSRYFPVEFTNFSDGAETIAVNLQGGAVIGDLPPYEAFPLGGTNSVRGFDEGEVGSARYFVQSSVEYRFPLLKVTEQIPLGGVLFLDFASDLGSGEDVPGQPAVVRDKPGWGVGYGVGLRARTPFGQIRLDYGWNSEGDSRLHFGLGERF
ncbi:MAG TPA: BamA/TamA family outer membrane protein, partial [Coleofasciculaceae cyanobacterium]